MTNGFTKRKVGTLTLGEKLRKVRSDKRISLNEVSRVTRIRLEYLEFIEEGKYDLLPADVYVRGFLKSYGEFLGVDEQSLIKLFEKEKGIKKNLEKSQLPQKKNSIIKPLSISSFVFTPQKALAFFAVVVVLLSFAYLYLEAGSLTDTPRLIIFNPQTNFETEEKSIFLEGKTDKDARVFVNNQPVLVDDEGKFKEDISLQSGINVINVKAVNKFQKETSENITVQAKYLEENVDDLFQEESGSNFSEQPLVASENDGAVQIELNVDPGPVWISVKADSNLVFSGTMLVGDVHKFSASEKIEISSGRANATFVKYNGEEKVVLGNDDGAIKDVVFIGEKKNIPVGF